MSDTLLSICIPTYNRPELLLRTIKSIPDHPEVEIIVTDNSNNFESKEIVEKTLCYYGTKWTYHKNNFPSEWPGPRLMVENFNQGIRLASGQYICFIHDDDFLYPSGLPKILNKIKTENRDVFMFGINLVDYNGDRKRTQKAKTDAYYPPLKALKKLLSNSSFVRFPAIIARKSVYDAVGYFNAERKGPTDLDMWARIFSEYGVYHVSDVVAAYTIHDGAETMKTFNEGIINILLNIFDDIESRKLLSQNDLNESKALFFHQFILAGTYRILKKGKLKEAGEIMNLFKLPPINALPAPLKWLPLRILFTALQAASVGSRRN